MALLNEQYDICKLAFEGTTGVLKHKIKENPHLATTKDEVKQTIRRIATLERKRGNIHAMGHDYAFFF